MHSCPPLADSTSGGGGGGGGAVRVKLRAKKQKNTYLGDCNPQMTTHVHVMHMCTIEAS